MQFEYKNSGVCSRGVRFEVENEIVNNVEFIGGCHGNTQGVAALANGMHIDEVIRRIKGIIAIGLQFIAVSSLNYAFRSEEKKKFFYQTSGGKFNYRLRMLTGFLFSFRSYKKWGDLFDRFVRGDHK